MAFKLPHAQGDIPVNHEINVTPFIDVMLVLLIIFMVAAPLATVDVKVDLPVSTAASAAKPDKPIFLTLKADGRMFLNDDAVAADGLAGALTSLTGGDVSPRIFLRADKTVTYDNVMKAMNGLRTAGYLQVALVGLEAGVAP